MNKIVCFFALLNISMMYAQQKGNNHTDFFIKNKEFKELVSKFKTIELPIVSVDIKKVNKIPFNPRDNKIIEKYLCFTKDCFSDYQLYVPWYCFSINNNYVGLIYNWEDDYSGYAILAIYDKNGNKTDYMKFLGGKEYSPMNEGELNSEDMASTLDTNFIIKTKKLKEYLGKSINGYYQFEGVVEILEYRIDDMGKLKLVNKTKQPRMLFDTRLKAPQGEFPVFLPIDTIK